MINKFPTSKLVRYKTIVSKSKNFVKIFRKFSENFPKFFAKIKIETPVKNNQNFQNVCNSNSTCMSMSVVIRKYAQNCSSTLRSRDKWLFVFCPLSVYDGCRIYDGNCVYECLRSGQNLKAVYW